MAPVQGPEYEVRRLDVDESTLLDQVVRLGDLHKKWLGLLTRTAFAEYAADQKVLIAVADDVVFGYALFALPRQRVRLAHLCVAEEARRKGVARASSRSSQPCTPIGKASCCAAGESGQRMTTGPPWASPSCRTERAGAGTATCSPPGGATTACPTSSPPPPPRTHGSSSR